MPDVSPREVLERLRAGYSLPSLSVVALQMVEMAAREETSATDLANLIEKDPALTVRLLRLANSAYMRIGEPVTTIEQSILRLGANRLRIMALSLSLRDTFPMGKVGEMDYEEFWRTSLYRGLIAKALAHKLRCCNPDEAFVSGLVQEIGLLVFFDLFLKGRDEEIMASSRSIADLLTAERARYGVDHRQVGAIALTYWNFPQDIVACQRIATDMPPQDGHALSGLCDAANGLSALLIRQDVHLNETLSFVENNYGLDHEVVSDIMITAFEEVEDVARSLSVELNRERDLLLVMEKANETLARISERVSISCGGGQLPSFAAFGQAGDEKTVAMTLQAVAHEIRNPLTAVGGFVKRLFSSLEPSSRSWEYAKIVLEETNKLETALSQIERRICGCAPLS